MFVGKILENGNSAFECRDSKIVEEFQLLRPTGDVEKAFRFDGFAPLIPQSIIGNIGDMYKKSEDLDIESLFSYVLENANIYPI